MAKLNPQVIVKTVSDVVLSDAGQKFLCGTYSDGKTRSFADAMRDEYISPKDREKWEKKKAKKKGKKKDKKKKKRQSLLEAELFRIMEKSLKAAMDKALDDIFRDWK